MSYRNRDEEAIEIGRNLIEGGNKGNLSIKKLSASGKDADSYIERDIFNYVQKNLRSKVLFESIVRKFCPKVLFDNLSLYNNVYCVD